MGKSGIEYYYWFDAANFLADVCELHLKNGKSLKELAVLLQKGTIPVEFKNSIRGPYRVKKFARPCPIVWRETKKRILARDDYTCAYCGVRGGRLEVDHILPISRGGNHSDDNLTAACVPCNRRKSNKTVQEWRINNGA